MSDDETQPTEWELKLILRAVRTAVSYKDYPVIPDEDSVDYSVMEAAGVPKEKYRLATAMFVNMYAFAYGREKAKLGNTELIEELTERCE